MVTAPEKELIQRLLAFVNLKQITSARKIERLFENIPGMTGKLTSYQGDLRQPRQEQVAARLALDNIVGAKQKGITTVIQAINASLQHVTMRVALTPHGEMMILAGTLGVSACVAYALALIVDLKRGVRDRLSKCGAPDCGRYVLRFGRGRPWRHCNEDHRRAADAIAAISRSQIKRDKAKAERLLLKESVDYVRGALPRLKKIEIERIAEKVMARKNKVRSKASNL